MLRRRAFRMTVPRRSRHNSIAVPILMGVLVAVIFILLMRTVQHEDNIKESYDG